MNTFNSVHLLDLTNGQRRSSRLFVILGLGLALALQFSPRANAQNTINCAAPVTSAPSGPAIVSVASTSYGQVLVEGSAGYTGCSLYVVTSDELHTLTSGAEPFACSDSQNVLQSSCDAVLWPALLTDGAPIAGPGVNPKLLGTVTRTDVLSGVSVQQVTYAGLPLYRFFLDATRSFPVYTLSAEPGQELRYGWGQGIACRGVCAAVPWPPVLTAKQPEAGPGIDQKDLGTIVRPDGSQQVTYKGKPVYLFYRDAYIGGITGTQGIYGDGEVTPWGVFNTVPLP